MYIKNYLIADNVIRISSQYSDIHKYCKNYVIENFDDKDMINIIVTKEDIALERFYSELKDKKDGISIRSFADEYLEILAVYRKIVEALINKDILLFHGSAIAVDGWGYLFAARSGVGKSTHTKLWMEHFGNRAIVVNDDKPLLKVTEQGIVVYGTPWDGKHRRSNNVAVPLKAIAFLERDLTNYIVKRNGNSVYIKLFQQIYCNKNPIYTLQVLNLIDTLICNMEFYELHCNMELESVIVASDMMCR